MAGGEKKQKLEGAREGTAGGLARHHGLVLDIISEHVRGDARHLRIAFWYPREPAHPSGNGSLERLLLLLLLLLMKP